MKIILMMAITLDGKIGKTSDHLSNWTSREDKQQFIEITKKVGVIIMGKNTFDTFKKPLRDRLNVVFTDQEDLLVIDDVMWVSGEIESVLEELESKGYKEAILGGGSYLNTLFLKRGLVDEMIVTIEPKIFGTGLSLFKEEFDLNLELLDIKKLNNNTINLHYKVI